MKQTEKNEEFSENLKRLMESKELWMDFFAICIRGKKHKGYEFVNRVV